MTYSMKKFPVIDGTSVHEKTKKEKKNEIIIKMLDSDTTNEK